MDEIFGTRSFAPRPLLQAPEFPGLSEVPDEALTAAIATVTFS